MYQAVPAKCVAPSVQRKMSNQVRRRTDLGEQVDKLTHQHDNLYLASVLVRVDVVLLAVEAVHTNSRS